MRGIKLFLISIMILVLLIGGVIGGMIYLAVSDPCISTGINVDGVDFGNLSQDQVKAKAEAMAESVMNTPVVFLDEADAQPADTTASESDSDTKDGFDQPADQKNDAEEENADGSVDKTEEKAEDKAEDNALLKTSLAGVGLKVSADDIAASVAKASEDSDWLSKTEQKYFGKDITVSLPVSWNEKALTKTAEKILANNPYQESDKLFLYYDEDGSVVIDDYNDEVTLDQDDISSQLKEMVPAVWQEADEAYNDEQFKAPAHNVLVSFDRGEQNKGETAAELEDIDCLLAEFTTYYDGEYSTRCNNIRLSAAAINGLIMEPGDVFSFNGVVGERTAARGYQEAGVIMGNQLVDGLGGGICQVSTTLYNAVLLANLEVVDRECHGLPVSYVDVGCDATVDYGNIDFQFRNSTGKNIYLTTATGYDWVTVAIYGNSAYKKDVKIISYITDYISPGVQYIDDNTLAPGEEVVESSGSSGYWAETVRQVLENGEVVSEETMPSSQYDASDEIIRRGI